MTAPYYTDDQVTLYGGDCIEVLASLPANSIDAVCTDPPYGIEFMGKAWDSFSNDAVSSSWDTRGRSMTACPKRDARSRPGGAVTKTHISDNPRCRKCSRTINGRDTAKGFKVCHCEQPDIYAPSTSALKYQTWCQQWATECLRVLKPGGHMLAFGGTRTWHRLACAIEDAGFEIRDSIAWLYGSGFPKSLDVSKAIDKRPGVSRHAEFAAHLVGCRETAGLSRADVSEHVVGTRSGACWNWEHHQFPEAKWWPTLRGLLNMDGRWDAVIAEADRERIGTNQNVERAAKIVSVNGGGEIGFGAGSLNSDITAPATDAAKTWRGYGTALKPSHESIVLARKPLQGTVAANVLAHGCGALNIDATRIPHGDDVDLTAVQRQQSANPIRFGGAKPGDEIAMYKPAGRWPPNVVLDEHAAAELDRQTGTLSSGGGVKCPPGRTGGFIEERTSLRKPSEYVEPDSGGGSRFFPVFKYTPKAPGSERPTADGVNHPTVKPVDLIRWLVRLITPPHGTVLDCFAGTGTTGEAAIKEHKHAILIEREPTYLPLIVARLSKPMAVGLDFEAGA